MQTEAKTTKHGTDTKNSTAVFLVIRRGIATSNIGNGAVTSPDQGFAFGREYDSVHSLAGKASD